jgi:hypothetical protein
MQPKCQILYRAKKVSNQTTMATTKRAQYRFVVKEGPTFMREVREGVLEPVSDPFITAEPCGTEPVHERPLIDPDFLSFDLGPGTSFDQAQQVADFLNNHVQWVAITRFGDPEDAAREVSFSDRVREIDFERLSAAVTDLKETLAIHGLEGAIGSLEAVESVCADVIRGWSRALSMSQEILNKFGQGEDPDA